MLTFPRSTIGPKKKTPAVEALRLLLGFLQGRHRAGRDAASIAALLTTMARRKAGSEDLALLADLERSIDSFEELHRR